MNQPPPNPVFRPEFVRSLRMHPLAAAVTAAIVAILILAFALRETPVYEAEALVDISPGVAHILDEGQAGLFDSNRYDSSIAQQIQTAERLDILTGVVQSLPAGTWRQPGESAQAAATRLQSGLKIQRVATSYQVSFTLKGPSPQKTADTLNATVDAFLAMGRKDALTTSGQRIDILSEEKGRIQAELDADRKEQARLSTALGVANPGFDTGNPYDAQLSGLRTELAAAREQHEIAAAQLASVTGTGSTSILGLTAASEDLIAGDAGLSSMRATISQRRATLAGQMAGLTPENPIYKQDQGEIYDLDRSLESTTAQLKDKAALHLQDKLRNDLARTGDVEARVNAQLAAQTYAATSASPKLQRATELTADIQRLMRRFASVDDTLRSLQLDSTAPGAAHLALAATAPLTPAPSRKRLLLLAALPLAALCGLLVAVFLRKRDPHVYTGPDVTAVLGFPPLAVLPDAPDVSEGVMAEYILRLAGGVENAYRASGARTFVLTAVSAGLDTRETIVHPLEARLLQLGLRVATVTGVQVMNPAFAEVAGYEPLAISHGPGEGIAPRNLELMKAHADLVFVDTLPLLHSAETEYLVRCADATILIARSGVTLCAELKDSASLLENLHVKGIAAVLEGLHLRHADASFRASIASMDARPSASFLAPASPRIPVRMDHPVDADNAIAVPAPNASRHENFQPVMEQTHDFEPLPAEQVGSVPIDAAMLPEKHELVQELLHESPPPVAEQMAAPTVVEVPELHHQPETLESSAVVPQEFTSFPTHELTSVPPPMPEIHETAVAQAQPATEPESVPSASLHVWPLADFSFAEPPRKNWLQRLFTRDDFTLLKSTPESNEDGHPAPLAHTEPIHTQWQPLVPNQPIVDADIVPLAEEPAMVLYHHEQGTIEPDTDTNTFSTETHEPEMVLAEPILHAQSLAEMPTTIERPIVELPEHEWLPEVVAEDDAPEPVLEHVSELLHAVPDPAVPEVIESQLAEPSLPLPVFIDEPKPIEHLPLPAPIQLVAPLAPIASIPVERPAIVLPVVPEPVRTGRWDPSPLSRTDITPWRDRRVAAPNAEYGETERRFNWKAPSATPASSAKPIAMVAPRFPERTRPEPVQPASPSRLTRNWGLLSRFSDPNPSTPDDPAHSDEGDSSRNYRRG